MSPVRGAVLVPVLAASVLAGCMVAKRPAPVVQRGPEPVVRAVPEAKPAQSAVAKSVDPRPATYAVKRGDTLYGIALDHGQDYRDLARWNNIVNPNAIEAGQVLWVRDPAAATVAAAAQPSVAAGAVITPYQTAPAVQGREVGAQPVQPLPETAGARPERAQDPSILRTPKAVKLPYSDAALAKLQAPAEPAAPSASAPAAAAPERADTASGNEADAVDWGWPTRGKVVASFNENGGPKGVQIAGEMGQAILASAGGRVVYTGSGLRGYGNLVIIKHNNTYLSAYAHNRAVLVKQGDSVAKGQKIAEMGSSDASRTMLHFEIRRLGKPVDPIRFLPPV
ncbi:MAG: peptidoglycan DD-metalloendopeptidase family protein [Burkholderiales bacterium]|nr:peptidoglycan DD-metalloendopeptidase family protein [Burkholderiales bacterium]